MNLMITMANFAVIVKSKVCEILLLVLRIYFLSQILLLVSSLNANSLGTIPEEITAQLLPMGVCNRVGRRSMLKKILFLFVLQQQGKVAFTYQENCVKILAQLKIVLVDHNRCLREGGSVVDFHAQHFLSIFKSNTEKYICNRLGS